MFSRNSCVKIVHTASLQFPTFIVSSDKTHISDPDRRLGGTMVRTPEEVELCRGMETT